MLLIQSLSPLFISLAVVVVFTSSVASVHPSEYEIICRCSDGFRLNLRFSLSHSSANKRLKSPKATKVQAPLGGCVAKTPPFDECHSPAGSRRTPTSPAASAAAEGVCEKDSS